MRTGPARLREDSAGDLCCSKWRRTKRWLHFVRCRVEVGRVPAGCRWRHQYPQREDFDVSRPPEAAVIRRRDCFCAPPHRVSAVGSLSSRGGNHRRTSLMCASFSRNRRVRQVSSAATCPATSTASDDDERSYPMIVFFEIRLCRVSL